MRRNTFLLIVLFLGYQIVFPKPVFTKGRYLISCLATGTSGTVSPGNNTYPLVFQPNRNSETAKDSDYWIINDIGNGKFSFQNAATHKYIRYNSFSADRTALTMTTSLQADESTSFSLEHRSINRLNYYIIRSIKDRNKIWNKRAMSYSGVFPVGTYTMIGTALEYFLFYDSEGVPVKDDMTITPILPSAKPTIGCFSSFLDSLTFGGKSPAADTSRKEFYLSINGNKLENDLSLSVQYIPKKAFYKLYIDGVKVENGSIYTFKHITGATKAMLQLKKGDLLMATATLKFSSLPFVQLYSDASLTNTYSLGKIVVSEPDKTANYECLLAELRTRGAFASMFQKKAFAINLKTSDGLKSLEKSFLGLRTDNNWILDAMAIDCSRMRNRVSTDLWNDFSTKPYYANQEPNMVNGTRGRFVEVFVNDSYNGLYCLTEKIDRQQLHLKKVKAASSNTTAQQRGALYKADEWSFESLMGPSLYAYRTSVEDFDNSSDSWCRYVIKHPDLQKGEPIDWKPLRDAVLLTSYLTPDSVFNARAPQVFDLPVVRDYYLFLELLLAADNQGKNLYYSIYDCSLSNKMSITPWDLDATWGRRWDGSNSVTGASQSWDKFVNNMEHGQNNLFLRLKRLNTAGFNDQLRSRYKELRGTYFDQARLVERFRHYHAQLKSSGALRREIARWSSMWIKPDLNTDLTYLSSWINLRLNFLDRQYLGAPYSNAASSLTDRSAKE